MTPRTTLPPGQYEVGHLPRFGLTPFAVRFPTTTDSISVQIVGDVQTPVEVGAQLQRLARVEQCSDFHCVTTWSCRGLQWSGFRFADFYRQIVVPLAAPASDAAFVVLRGQDARQQLIATGIVDGRPADLTRGVQFTSETPDVVKVDDLAQQMLDEGYQP